MDDDAVQLKLILHAPQGADDEALDRLTQQLRQEILELDVEDVDLVEAGEAPGRAKGDAMTLGTLLVTALASSGALPSLFGLLESWLTRHSLRSATLEIDGDKLEVKGVSSREQQALIEAWMSRHKLILTSDR